ncbi:carbohydrate sulfotransferase 4-like [Saccostrea echinata]|uniref:carbohydrate sulfotransferase 4-like n=1 Tax=Saccostrea echinata TaxID=191078 RepID=UPI002A7EA928|nr:carbohydrate sulfotransferase 4-like [Saccostrea echinata]
MLLHGALPHSYLEESVKQAKEKFRHHWLSEKESYQQSKRQKVRNILIVAYQRSGSTLTSEILQHGGSTSFFSMEPLWQTYRTCQRHINGICCPNNTCRSPLYHKEEINNTLSVFRAIYTCNFATLSYEVLKSFETFVSTGHEYVKKLKCFNYSSKHLKEHGFSAHYNDCIENLTRLCKSSSVIIIKTLRIDIKLANMLKTLLDNLYIVHLLRDPRAILHSRAKAGTLTRDSIHAQSKALCSMMYKNFVDASKNADIHTLLYERLVLKPQKVVKQLYKFCDLNFTIDASEWLHSFTNISVANTLKNRHRGNFAPYPKRSYEVSRKWRKTIFVKVNGIIQNSCDAILGVLGLRVFREEKELRNLAINVLIR